ncbi:MAG: hypothetical protein ACRDPW_10660 [Mycobacteriales bacterium]
MPTMQRQWVATKGWAEVVDAATGRLRQMKQKARGLIEPKRLPDTRLGFAV